MDPFLRWYEALERRHLQGLQFHELRRSVQALSSLYVERRGTLERRSAMDTAGKRAAFACYFAPLHFLLIRNIVQSLKAGDAPASRILDLGCGVGSAGAAWALAMEPKPKVIGVDRHPWAVQEARWTYAEFGLPASARLQDLRTLRLPRGAAVVAGFTLNELPPDVRDALSGKLLQAAARGAPVLVVEPIAKRLAPEWGKWWTEWARNAAAAGGIEAEWRFPALLPERLALLDRAAGLDHRELTGRSLWFPGR